MCFGEKKKGKTLANLSRREEDAATMTPSFCLQVPNVTDPSESTANGAQKGAGLLPYFLNPLCYE